MMDWVVHKLEEFPQLPWDKLDPQECSKDWSFGRGGHGFDNKTYTISMYEGDICHIWPLPAPIAAMIEMHSSVAVEEALRQVRVALHID
jgi:hypothetical protein